MSDKLNAREWSMIGAEALFNLVPVGGGTLATLLFAPGNERRLKRLERVYQELAAEIREKGIVFASNLEDNREAIAAIIEEFTERVQREHTEEKREFFKKFFINTLKDEALNYDRSMTFLRVLSDITYMEVELLRNLYKRKGSLTFLRDVQIAPEDDYEQLSALYRLQSLGFIRSGYGSQGFNMSMKPPILTNDLALSPYGEAFVDYVIA